MYSIHRRNIGASLIEINEGMSEIIIRQNKLMQKMKIENNIFEVHVKCAMKVEEKNDCHVKNLLKGGLYKAISEDWLVRFQ